MITGISAVFASALSKLFYAFFTEKMVSKIVISVLKILAAKTTNTIDDEIIAQLERNMNL